MGPTNSVSRRSSSATARPSSVGQARPEVSGVFSDPSMVRGWLARLGRANGAPMSDQVHDEFQNIDFALIGNCRVAALVDRRGRIVWWCFPRFDSDPVFSRLLAGDEEKGFCEVALADLVDSDAKYLRNTAVVETILSTRMAAQVRVMDFAPRFDLYGRTYRPPQIIRRIEPLHGLPRIAIKVRPTCNYGRPVDEIVVGSNHIRYLGGPEVMRLTTDAPMSYITAEIAFVLTQPLNLIFGQDDPFRSAIDVTCREFLDRTREHWLELGAPSQRAVRMAIGGRPRGDHPQALQLRGNRRHRRRPHDFDPRSADHATHLGLSLLLVARRVFRRPRAESARRDRI